MWKSFFGSQRQRVELDTSWVVSAMSLSCFPYLYTFLSYSLCPFPDLCNDSQSHKFNVCPFICICMCVLILNLHKRCSRYPVLFFFFFSLTLALKPFSYGKIWSFFKSRVVSWAPVYPSLKVKCKPEANFVSLTPHPFLVFIDHSESASYYFLNGYFPMNL